MTEPEFESILEGYPVRVSSFEGPLDLLLHLIKKNEVNIYDIPIALVTRQYLAYLELMKELNLDIAGEFLVMAATLIHVKSRTLLPRPDPGALAGCRRDRFHHFAPFATSLGKVGHRLEKRCSLHANR